MLSLFLFVLHSLYFASIYLQLCLCVIVAFLHCTTYPVGLPISSSSKFVLFLPLFRLHMPTILARIMPITRNCNLTIFAFFVFKRCFHKSTFSWGHV